MNEWMNVYFYTAHITWCLMAVYNAIEWDSTSADESTKIFKLSRVFIKSIIVRLQKA